MRVRRSDFTKVVPTADEVADHVARYGRTPAVDRAECLRCGTRIWYSGLAIGSHLRGCPRKYIAPVKVVDFYRALHGTSMELEGEDFSDPADRVFIAQAFRPGDGWVDLPAPMGKHQPVLATHPNVEVLRRCGYTALAFDLFAPGPAGRAFVTADFPIKEVRA